MDLTILGYNTLVQSVSLHSNCYKSNSLTTLVSGKIMWTSLLTCNIFHNHQLKHICKEMKLGANKFVFLFGSTTNVLAMGVTTQGHVVYFVVRKPI
jgi:hypothetical protein